MALTEQQVEAILRVKEKSEDNYDQNVIFIAAGTLVLSLTFIEKITMVKDSKWIAVLILSWVFLAITILVNLISHQLSSKYHDECILAYGNCVKKRQYRKADAFAAKKNRIIRSINWITTSCLVIGIFLLVAFCSLNIS